MKRICIVLHSFSDFYEKALPNYSSVKKNKQKFFSIQNSLILNF